jgi:cell cycle sensor histidine kinase DivJ
LTAALSIRRFLDALLHPSVHHDAIAAARHRIFIGLRLFGSFTVLASFPLYVALRGVPSVIEVFALSWLIAPIAIAYFLSRTGRYERAHALSALALAAIVTAVSICTGGIASFAAVWLVVVPLEAALSTSRKVVGFAIAVALGCAGLLIALGALGLLPASAIAPHLAMTFAGVGIVGVCAYCALLAFLMETLGQTTRGLLNAEEERYRLLARNMSDVIARHRRNGAIEFISPAADALFETLPGELTGHGLFDRVHVADRPAYLTALAEVARGAAERDVEFRVKRGQVVAGRPDPGFVWIEMRCRPFARREDGAPHSDTEVVTVLRDITDRKTQEHALAAAHAEAERAHAAKGQFLATMSHELRTPLNAIIGFSEMIANEAELRLKVEKRTEYAKLINESGQHLLSVVNSILDMSKMESGGFEICAEPFHPCDAIRSCSNLMALKARDGGIDLVVAAPDSLPSMIGDERAFKQILLNLVSNAIKFTDRGGRVTVSAAVEGSKLLLSVADTGVGISPEDMKRVGDPFFQAEKTYRRRHEGTGLGLSIVKSLVGLQHGELNVCSKLDEGTTVTIALPLDLDCEVRRPAATVTTLEPRQNAKFEEKVRKSA